MQQCFGSRLGRRRKGSAPAGHPVNESEPAIRRVRVLYLALWPRNELDSQPPQSPKLYFYNSLSSRCLMHSPCPLSCLALPCLALFALFPFACRPHLLHSPATGPRRASERGCVTNKLAWNPAGYVCSLPPIVVSVRLIKPRRRRPIII